MFKFTKEELGMFLKDIPFFNGEESFCFGSTLADAGRIFRDLVKARECRCGNG